MEGETGTGGCVIGRGQGLCAGSHGKTWGTLELGMTASELCSGRGTGSGEQGRPSPRRLFAIVLMCTHEGRKKWKGLETYRRPSGRILKRGEITKTPEQRNQNENKHLSVPLL